MEDIPNDVAAVRWKNFFRLKGKIEAIYGPLPDEGWTMDQWESGLEALLAEVRAEARAVHRLRD